MTIERQNPLAITDVRDSQGTVPDGGTTKEIELTLSGTGPLDGVVSILDNGQTVSGASVVGGAWAAILAALAVGFHRFTVRTVGGPELSPWEINIEANLQLPAPSVVGAPGGVLDPMTAVSGARVLVAYSGMATTDIIGLSWDGQSDLVPNQNGSSMGSVTFNVPASAVAAVLGKTIGVLYAVVRNGNATPSELLHLQVQRLPETALTAPKIRQAPDDQNLDVSALTGDADLFVPVWPFIAVGQRISLRFEGTKADGSAYNWVHDTWQNLPISSAGEPNTTVKLVDLQQLKDGSALRLIFEVSFDGGATTVAFPVRTLTVIAGVDLESPVITRITDSKGNVIPERGGTSDTTVVIAGTAEPGSTVEIFNENTSWGSEPVVNGSWTKRQSGRTASAYRITVKGLYGDYPVSEARTFTILNVQSSDFERSIDIPPNTPVRFYSGMVVTTTNYAYRRARVENNGQGFGMFFSGNGLVDRFDLGGEANIIRIHIAASRGPTNVVEFFDGANVRIERRPIEVQTDYVLEYNSSRKCAYFTITVDEIYPEDGGMTLNVMEWGSYW